MFADCQKITSTPIFNATYINTYAYSTMFSGCKGLTDLKNTVISMNTVETLGCLNMFSGCSNLVSSPEMIDANNLAADSLRNMFTMDMKLREIKF
jgi:hypothetical protein